MKIRRVAAAVLIPALLTGTTVVAVPVANAVTFNQATEAQRDQAVKKYTQKFKTEAPKIKAEIDAISCEQALGADLLNSGEKIDSNPNEASVFIVMLASTLMNIALLGMIDPGMVDDPEVKLNTPVGQQRIQRAVDLIPQQAATLSLDDGAKLFAYSMLIGYMIFYKAKKCGITAPGGTLSNDRAVKAFQGNSLELTRIFDRIGRPTLNARINGGGGTLPNRKTTPLNNNNRTVDRKEEDSSGLGELFGSSGSS